MTTISANPSSVNAAASSRLDRKLRQTWRKQRRVAHTQGLLRLLLWVAALLLLNLLIDWLFLLPPYGRVMLMMINVTMLAWVLYRGWWTRLQPWDPVRVALQVEARHPELRNLVVSYVQYSAGKPDAYVSPALINAMRRQAIEVTAPINFKQIVDARELQRIALFCSGTLALFAAVSINWPTVMQTLLLRLANPAAAVSYPTRTQIIDFSDDLVIQQGDAVTIRAAATGLLPTAGTLMVRPPGGQWETLSMPMAEAGEYLHHFEGIHESFQFHVRIGDAVSATRRVDVVPPPTPRRIQVTITFPEYTGEKPRTVDALNLEALEGSRLVWRIDFDQPLQSAHMLLAEDERQAMTLTDEGRTASFETRAVQSFAYRLELTEKAHGYRFDDPVRYFVQVTRDLPPDVHLLSPVDDVPATLGRRVDLEFTATDDYGLAEAFLVYALNGEEEQRMPLADLAGRSAQQRITWEPARTIAGLSEGQVLSYAVEVADNRAGEDGPNISRSQTRRLFLVSVPEYLRWISERRQGVRSGIDEVHQLETEAADEVGRIKRDTDLPPANP